MKTVIKKKDNFTMVHNELINDSTISFKAKGILLYMLSKSNNWDYNPKEIAKNSSEGVNAVYSGIKELVSARYISRKKSYTGQVEYYIFEDKTENNIPDYILDKEEEPNHKNHDEVKPNNENPHNENHDEENPHEENRDVLIRKNTTKNRIKEKKESNKEREELHVFPLPDYFDYSETQFVKLTQKQYDRLITDYKKETVDKYIIDVETYCVANGKKYKDYNLTIRKWIDNDKLKSSNKPKTQEDKMKGFMNL